MAVPDPLKKAYKILSWASLAGLVLVIVLVLRKGPATDVPTDPAAAARAEKKFEAADQAKAAGQPAQVALDRTELNSYLAQNLQLEGGQPSATGQAGSAAPTASSSAAPTGGAAYGMPRYSSTLPVARPRTWPSAVPTTSGDPETAASGDPDAAASGDLDAAGPVPAAPPEQAVAQPTTIPVAAATRPRPTATSSRPAAARRNRRAGIGLSRPALG